MPLTIADADVEKGTITIVVQKVGLSSQKLCSLNEGDYITDVVGPLGNPTPKENFLHTSNDILFDDEEKNRNNWTGKAFPESEIMTVLASL